MVSAWFNWLRYNQRSPQKVDCLFTIGILLGINLLFFILLGSIIMLRRVEKENGQREAQAVASELGLELSPHSNTLAGVYKDRTIHLTIDKVRYGRSYIYRVDFQLTVDAPTSFELVIKEKSSIGKLLKPSIPLDKQIGATLVQDRFIIKSLPAEIEKKLFASLDFCYGILLFPSSVTRFEQGKIVCRFESLTITNILFPKICSTLAEIARIIEEIAK